MEAKKKLNPLWAKWPMELALISGFFSVKADESSLWLPLDPGWDTDPSQVSSQQTLDRYHLPTPEGWKAELALAENKVTQIFKSWQSWDRTGDLVVERLLWKNY